MFPGCALGFQYHIGLGGTPRHKGATARQGQNAPRMQPTRDGDGPSVNGFGNRRGGVSDGAAFEQHDGIHRGVTGDRLGVYIERVVSGYLWAARRVDDLPQRGVLLPRIEFDTFLKRFEGYLDSHTVPLTISQPCTRRHLIFFIWNIY